MTRLPQVALLADGRRLHLQDGPIDLIVEARGTNDNIKRAYDAAIERFTGLLDTLCQELAELRSPAHRDNAALRGVVARRMSAAVAPFASAHFITPMAAVAGAVAEEIVGAMVEAANLDSAYVNNGGDIALHLSDGASFNVGLVVRADQPNLIGATRITSADPSRGIATSGVQGRSFSFGIADAVTVLARTASMADAAATIIANAVDLPNHPGIIRQPANDILSDSDLGERLVTRHVGPLSFREITAALEAGKQRARDLLSAGLIEGAALTLHGIRRVVALVTVEENPAASGQYDTRTELGRLANA